jgi:penicillin-binding protein 1A
MWDLPRPKKSWYRRWWFTIPFYGLLFVGVAAGIIYYKIKAEYEGKARQFDYTRLQAMEDASLILDRKGTVIGRIFTQNREQVPLADLSKNLIDAVIAREDARFREHKGVDYKGVARAVYENWRAGYSKQGASTITQQLARNTFPEQLPATDKSKERKLLEMFVAMEIEKLHNKEKILELYLNRVFFGNGFFGAEAAAKGYFGKRAKDLNVSEAAMLAGLLRSPERLSPWRNYGACEIERRTVLNNMLLQDKITREQYDAAYAEEPVLRNKRPLQQESYAADMVFQQVLGKVGKDRAMSEGLRIYTTVDPVLQRKAEETLRAQITSVESRPGYEHQNYSQYDQIFRAGNKQPTSPDGKRILPEYLQGAVVMLDNRTGAILAIVGGREFPHSQLNRATQVSVPPGTAFKPIVYAAAFERGFFPGTALSDSVMDNTKVMMGGTTGILGEWGPERADNRFEGTISAREALVKSKNAATVRMGMMTGIQTVLDLADEAGISAQLTPYPKTYLGGSEVSPMELTLAYTMFPNGGIRPSKSFIISRIDDKMGNVLFEEKPEMVTVVKPTTAFEVHDCLRQVLDMDGTAERASSELGLKRYPLGGKTGTAYNFTDLWFVGYSSEVTCSVWMGFDQQRGKPKKTIFRGAFSKDFALPVWAELIKASFATHKPQEIIQPRGIIRVEICRLSGGLACEKCLEGGIRTTYQEIATEEQAPRDACPVHSGIVPASPTVNGAPVAGAVVPKMIVRNVEQQVHTPVALKEPTVIGNDPYGSVQAVQRLRELAGVGNAQAPLVTSDEIPVGEPTTPAANVNVPAPRPLVLPPTPSSDVKLDQPEAVKFN